MMRNQNFPDRLLSMDRIAVASSARATVISFSTGATARWPTLSRASDPNAVTTCNGRASGCTVERAPQALAVDRKHLLARVLPCLPDGVVIPMGSRIIESSMQAARCRRNGARTRVSYFQNCHQGALFFAGRAFERSRSLRSRVGCH